MLSSRVMVTSFSNCKLIIIIILIIDTSLTSACKQDIESEKITKLSFGNSSMSSSAKAIACASAVNMEAWLGSLQDDVLLPLQTAAEI